MSEDNGQDPTSLYSDRELLEMMAKQTDWLTTAVDILGKQNNQILGMFNMIMQGIAASPMGGMLKKQMEQVKH